MDLASARCRIPWTFQFGSRIGSCTVPIASVALALTLAVRHFGDSEGVERRSSGLVTGPDLALIDSLKRDTSDGALTSVTTPLMLGTRRPRPSTNPELSGRREASFLPLLHEGHRFVVRCLGIVDENACRCFMTLIRHGQIESAALPSRMMYFDRCGSVPVSVSRWSRSL